MTNYIVINGVTYDLVKREEAAAVPAPKLADFAVGEVAKIGSHQMIVLDHIAGGTLLLRKGMLDEMTFGESNNYDGSDVDTACNEFAEEIAAIVGEDNILQHEVDLTSDDGLKDYGVIQRKASLLTAEQYRSYVQILDKHKPDEWWWLSTPHSTAAHGNANWAKCVSPSGGIDGIGFSYGSIGVRPFCILKSDIFVSN